MQILDVNGDNPGKGPALHNVLEADDAKCIAQWQTVSRPEVVCWSSVARHAAKTIVLVHKRTAFYRGRAMPIRPRRRWRRMCGRVRVLKLLCGAVVHVRVRIQGARMLLAARRLLVLLWQMLRLVLGRVLSRRMVVLLSQLLLAWLSVGLRIRVRL